MVEGTSHNPFAIIEISSSSFFKVMVGNVPIHELNIGGKASKIDIETVIYFDDDRRLVLDARRVNYKIITLLNHSPPLYSKYLNVVN